MAGSKKERGRGRPPHKAGVLLTRDMIALKALEIAGEEGFAAVTMQRLASELGVTARALYNHIEDRQQIIDDAAVLYLKQVRIPPLRPADWRDSLKEAYAALRTTYRKYPRALLISLDEKVSAAGVDPKRLLLAEEFLEFFTAIGLTLNQAAAMSSGVMGDLFSFTLTIDYRYDLADENTRPLITQPVPKPWLDANPEISAPNSRAFAEQPPQTSDDAFTAAVELRLAAIEHLLRQDTEN